MGSVESDVARVQAALELAVARKRVNYCAP
jgi:hypothetical protein